MGNATRPDGELAAILTELEPLYAAVVEQMRDALQPLESFAPGSGAEHERRMLIALLSVLIYGAARAIDVLHHADVGKEIPSLVRSQFEMALKAVWIDKDQSGRRAKQILDSEPFERYWLTDGFPLRKDLRDDVVQSCKSVVAENPALIRHQSIKRAGSQRPDFLAIRHALTFPSVEKMIKDVGLDPTLHPSVYLLLSVRQHGSIVELKNIPSELNPDGTVRFDISPAAETDADYLLQSLLYVVPMTSVLLRMFSPDNSAARKRNEELDSQRARLWERLKALDEQT